MSGLLLKMCLLIMMSRGDYMLDGEEYMYEVKEDYNNYKILSY